MLFCWCSLERPAREKVPLSVFVVYVCVCFSCQKPVGHFTSAEVVRDDTSAAFGGSRRAALSGCTISLAPHHLHDDERVGKRGIRLQQRCRERQRELRLRKAGTLTDNMRAPRPLGTTHVYSTYDYGQRILDIYYKTLFISSNKEREKCIFSLFPMFTY